MGTVHGRGGVGGEVVRGGVIVGGEVVRGAVIVGEGVVQKGEFCLREAWIV
jgi:hypothetical protein